MTKDAFTERERLEKMLPEVLRRRNGLRKSAVIHGKNDTIVPPEDAILTAQLLGLNQQDSDGVIWTDGGHSDVPADALLTALARIEVPVASAETNE